MNATVIVVVWLIATPVFLVLWLWTLARLRKFRKYTRGLTNQAEEKANALEKKYAGLISVEEEFERLKNEVTDQISKIDELRTAYEEKKTIFDRLKSELAIYDERVSFAQLGIYEPHFDFTDSEAYKLRINEIRERQKAMVAAKEATICPTDWTVDGSRSKGQAMINRQVRLTMRAFNNECEAAIANARWNNVVAMEKRILAAAKAIDAANTSMNLSLNDNYVALKLDELHLTHEYREQLNQEKEERAELARAEREEKKLLAEAENAEREERKYQVLLDKARKEAEVDVNNYEMARRISELEALLAEAHAKSERARAMAEVTKSGYVYVISNVGSFGEDVVKIGLTRRLDPDDRVRELGDASVPFSFDTHAMIYSDEAPALEAALHREFSEYRINMSNMRKEFFKATLDEVEAAVERLAPTALFFKDREAREWHETLARRKLVLEKTHVKSEAELPDTI